MILRDYCSVVKISLIHFQADKSISVKEPITIKAQSWSVASPMYLVYIPYLVKDVWFWLNIEYGGLSPM